MGPIGWIVVAALVCVALAKSVALLVSAVRQRDWEWALALPMVVAIGCMLTPFLVSLYTHPRKDLGATYTYVEQPLDFVGVAFIAGVWAVALIIAVACLNWLRANWRYRER